MKSKTLLLLLISLCWTFQVFGLELKFKTNSGSTSAGNISSIILTAPVSVTDTSDPNARTTTGYTAPNAGTYYETTSAGNSNAGLFLNDGITVLCKGTGNTWSVAIESTGFKNTADAFISIPNENFMWQPVYAGVYDNTKSIQYGTDKGDANYKSEIDTNLATGPIPFSNGSQTVYTSTSIDKDHSTLANTTGTEIQVKCSVVVPLDQPSGVYTADVRFTLTE